MEGETISILKCGHPDCRHEWIPRSTKKPKVCPKCKRYNWDKSPGEVENEVNKPAQQGESNKEEGVQEQ